MRHVPSSTSHPQPLQRAFSHLFSPKPAGIKTPPAAQHENEELADLTQAIHRNDIAVVEHHLNQGLDPNVRLPGGGLLLNEALRSNNPDMVNLLVERGADPTLHDINGASALNIVKDLYGSASGARAPASMESMLTMDSAQPPTWDPMPESSDIVPKNLTEQLMARRQKTMDVEFSEPEPGSPKMGGLH